jgi:hypothetical protein
MRSTLTGRGGSTRRQHARPMLPIEYSKAVQRAAGALAVVGGHEWPVGSGPRAFDAGQAMSSWRH